jgi:hypothetical protein
MWESGISGWQADWRAGSEQVRRHAVALRALVGARLTGAWTVWIGEGDWFADMPVVLQFDGSQQLEVCWQKFDDLSISWNTIDFDVPPTAWIDDLSWRPWAHQALRMNQDQAVTSVAATDAVLTTTDVDYPHREPVSKRFVAGLWIGTTGPGLHVFNALDENGLSTTCQSGALRPLA